MRSVVIPLITKKGELNKMLSIPFMQLGDLHISTPFKGISPSAGYMRRQELIGALKSAVEIIKSNNIPILFITGDLYENNYITQPTIVEISRLLASIPNTSVFISPGNHDYIHKRSFYTNWEWPSNVHIFTSPSVQRIDLNDVPVSIYGFAWDKPELAFPMDMKPNDASRINVAVIHADALSPLSPYLAIEPKKLMSWNMDYIALGHIHKPYAIDIHAQLRPLDTDSIQASAAYAGSTEPLNVSEYGDHGIIVGALSKNHASIRLLPIAKRRVINIDVSLTDCQTESDIKEKILTSASKSGTKNDMYSICLKGRVEAHLRDSIANIAGSITPQFFSLSIIDQTIPDYDLDYIKQQHSNDIIGKFVEYMEDEIQAAGPEQQLILRQSLYMGLEALLTQ